MSDHTVIDLSETNTTPNNHVRCSVCGLVATTRDALEAEPCRTPLEGSE